MTIAHQPIPQNNLTVSVYRWEGITMLDGDCKPLEVSGLSMASIQVDGDFDELTRLALLGSNDGKEFSPIKDLQGNFILSRIGGIYSIGDNVCFVKPYLKDGDTSTKLNVTLKARSIP